MSCGTPKCRAILSPRVASRCASPVSSTALLRRSSGTGVWPVRVPAFTVMVSLEAMLLESTFRVPASTMRSSVLTSPPTTDSPSPQAAPMTTSSRLPVAGLAVNMTPAASASTISWMTTARATSCGAMPARAR